MTHLDASLERFVSLPFSFEAVVRDIAAGGGDREGTAAYLRYLLDDSVVPDTVHEVFKPTGIPANASWDALPALHKIALFRQGASTASAPPKLLDGYLETDFARIAELNREPNSAIRLQLKDEILTELVRAYVEGVAAAQEAGPVTGASERDARLARLVGEYRDGGCINARVKRKLFPPADDEPVVTFFMLVTDRDILIADHCVRSFALLSGLSFRLVVFCNWITSANRAKYFDKWRKGHSFVEILEPAWMTEERRPSGTSAYGYGVEGPYERCEVPWDRELPQFRSRYYATVDADFEVIHPKFLRAMLDELQKSPALGFIGTDMNPDEIFTDHEHPGKNLQHTLVNTWLCIYRRETLACRVSHLYYREKSPDEGFNLNVWDSSGLRQLALRHIHGYRGSIIHPGYQPQFIHYGAFSKNRHLDESNIATWRQLMILRKIGHEAVLGPEAYAQYRERLLKLLQEMGITPPDSVNVSQLANAAYDRMFRHVDQSNPYKNGWGRLAPDDQGATGLRG